MLIYQLPPTDDPRALPSSTSVGEPAEERPARDRESSASTVADRRPLLAFFCPWARSLVFWGTGCRDQSSHTVRRRWFRCRKDRVKASYIASRRGHTASDYWTGSSPGAKSMVTSSRVGWAFRRIWPGGITSIDCTCEGRRARAGSVMPGVWLVNSRRTILLYSTGGWVRGIIWGEPEGGGLRRPDAVW